MEKASLPRSLRGVHAHFVGAKGTGMAALAEIFAARGAVLTGSDVADTYYTDAILEAIGLDLRVGYDASHLPPDAELVIYSAAYPRDSNPELVEADRRHLPVLSYPEALGDLSRHSDSSAVAGVHGKTTTTAMTGAILDALGAQATVLAGSAVGAFGGKCTLVRGDRHLVAETCEYRRHFLNFSPARILLTSVESDHQDYYRTYADILAAFCEFGASLPPGGLLVYCADDPGAAQAAAAVRKARPDLRIEPYGFSAEGPWRMEGWEVAEGESRFRIAAASCDFVLHVPGKHLARDAAGALALCASIAASDSVDTGSSSPVWPAARAALAAFSGSRRRSEVVGRARGVLFMDDYAHHPTAIAATMAGIREFWPSRRLVVDFMSHTYSRTAALMDDFAASFDAADILVLHGIYPSAREEPIAGVDGMTLYEKASGRRTRSGRAPTATMYTEEHRDAAAALESILEPGDIFLTMGAGDNWKLGRTLLDRFLAG